MNVRERKIYDISSIPPNALDSIGIEATHVNSISKDQIPIVPGFVITSVAFDEYLKDNDLIEFLTSKLSSVKDAKSADKISKEIYRMIDKSPIEDSFEEELHNFYKKFSGAVSSIVNIYSSSINKTLEESLDPSDENILFIYGFEELKSSIKKIWKSLFSPKALYYRERIQYEGPISIAVVVAKQPMTEISALVHTSNPLLGQNAIEIDAVLGNIEPLLMGELSGDRYVYDIKKNELIEKNILEQSWMQVFKLNKNKYQKKKFNISKVWKNRQKLSDNQIKNLAEITSRVVEKEKSPIDLYYSYELGKVYLNSIDLARAKKEAVQFETGSHLDKLKQKIESTMPETLETHLELPSIEVQTFEAWSVDKKAPKPKKKIKEYVKEVGQMAKSNDDFEEQNISAQNVRKIEKIPTLCEVYISSWDKLKFLELENNIDGVTSLSGDDFIAKTGIDIEVLIKNRNKTSKLLEKYINRVTSIVDKSVPILYTFASEAYRTSYDSIFGTARMIAGESIVDIELEVIRRIRNSMGHKNISVVVPFVRSDEEFIELKKIISMAKLRRSPSFKILIKIDNPSCALIVEDLIESSVDGFIYDIDLLAKHSLGFVIPGESPNFGLAKLIEISAKQVASHKITSIFQGDVLGSMLGFKDVLSSGATAIATNLEDLVKVKNEVKELEMKKLSKL